MPASAVKLAAVTAAMAANSAPPTDAKAVIFYNSIYDMILAALAAAQVMPGAFVAPPGTAGGPVTGVGGPIT